MAEHRWDTSPSVPRLSRPRPGPAFPEETGRTSGEPEDGETADDGVEALDNGDIPDINAGGRIPEQHRRRWLLSFRASVLAVSLLVGAVAGLVVFKGGGPPAEVASVELDVDSSSPAEDGFGVGAGESGSADQNQNQDQKQDQDQDQRQDQGGDATGTDQQVYGGGDMDGSAGPSAGSSVLVIHVAGAVTRPGVVRVPSGSRTGDAVDAAGGAAPDADLTAVNLAAPLQDGAMVIVPRIGEEAPGPGDGAGTGAGTGEGTGTGTGTGTGAAPGAGAPGEASGSGQEPGAGSEALVNINTASVQDLDTLPRVGPVIAERIIAWRNEHGRFARPEDIDAVPGIGEAMLAALLPLITV